jgi:phosphoribosylamine--glycine ligase
MMNILVIGSGGREHAMVWKLAQSGRVNKVWAAPGNGGTAGEKKAENFPLEADPASEEGRKALVGFAKTNTIGLTIVGPEAPLAAGLVDAFRAEGLAIVGPDKKAARLEASKVYAKAFMEKYGVRAADSKSFSDAGKALGYAKNHFGKKTKAQKKTDNTPPPLVIKADGLAAGKGVVIAEDVTEAEKCIISFMKKSALDGAGKSLVLEEFLEGKEVSVLAAVSARPGKKAVILPFIPARDHKRRFSGGKGPNTGGMGAVAPLPDFTPAAQKDFIVSILKPTLKGMEAEKMDYRGFIFFGLMVHNDLCSLLEYNARLGDPETQAVLPLMDSDFCALCEAILDGSLDSFNIRWKNKYACAPVAVAEGYPGNYRKGDPIAINAGGLDRLGAKLFVAGAQKGPGGFLGSGLRVTGGRVLAVCALGKDAGEAYTKAYDAIKFVAFEGIDFRTDIGREING